MLSRRALPPLAVLVALAVLLGWATRRDAESGDRQIRARVLVPWQTWLEVGASLGEQDFGDIGSLERSFALGERSRLQASVEVGWFRQSSDLARYDLSGVNAVSSLRWIR